MSAVRQFLMRSKPDPLQPKAQTNKKSITPATTKDVKVPQLRVHGANVEGSLGRQVNSAIEKWSSSREHWELCAKTGISFDFLVPENYSELLAFLNSPNVDVNSKFVLVQDSAEKVSTLLQELAESTESAKLSLVAFWLPFKNPENFAKEFSTLLEKLKKPEESKSLPHLLSSSFPLENSKSLSDYLTLGFRINSSRDLYVSDDEVLSALNQYDKHPLVTMFYGAVYADAVRLGGPLTKLERLQIYGSSFKLFQKSINTSFSKKTDSTKTILTHLGTVNRVDQMAIVESALSEKLLLSSVDVKDVKSESSGNGFPLTLFDIIGSYLPTSDAIEPEVPKAGPAL